MFVLLIQGLWCFGAYTNLPNMMNNRLIAAATGQLVSQSLGGVSAQTLAVALSRKGFLVGVVDAVIRRVTSELLTCPRQTYTDALITVSSSVARTAVSGLMHCYMQRRGFGINPILYAGIYAAADTAITDWVNVRLYADDEHNERIVEIVGSQAVLQGLFAMAVSAVGIGIGYSNEGSWLTQMTVIYGAVVAYIAFIELSLAFGELAMLG